ncbi:hypothetical protein [Anaeromicropila populeti]|uniref:Uncharacterized protein n=1 Tax=Anaeromicropila populeti TaxID=37658 RepID=A0A1I6KDS1_9FIRM|nr:hypothetical protein [Anaeromicropila populeti]SFR89010.1 hypothetical protein SAMN05661086_02374 [Anaeromicropila populeti]
MKYFLVESDKKYTDAPFLIDWFQKIRIENIEKGRSHLLPQRLVLPIRSNKDTVFIDVIFFPFLLVTETVRKVIAMYEPKTIFKQIALLDGKFEKTELYHLPILEKMNCELKKGQLVTEIELEYSKIKEKTIFQFTYQNSTYTVMRLDILESILRRGARGLSIIPLQVRGEAEDE